jgi:hypothetical protein
MRLLKLLRVGKILPVKMISERLYKFALTGICKK